MIKKLIAIILCIATIITPTVALGQDAAMTPIKKGQAAPFDGTLLTPTAVATIIAQANANKEYTTIEIKRTVELEVAKAALERAKLEAKLQYERDFHAAQLQIRNEKIEDLTKHVKPQSYEWWFVGGFASGLIVTIGAAFALSLAQK